MKIQVVLIHHNAKQMSPVFGIVNENQERSIG